MIRTHLFRLSRRLLLPALSLLVFASNPTVSSASPDSLAFVPAAELSSETSATMRVRPDHQVDAFLSERPQIRLSKEDLARAWDMLLEEDYSLLDEEGLELESGEASYYGEELAGRPTASGEIFDPKQLTAAHPSLPLGTVVRVTNLANDQSVVVRINDRGPFYSNRIIDLSRAAAGVIGMVRAGTARVKLYLHGH